MGTRKEAGTGRDGNWDEGGDPRINTGWERRRERGRKREQERRCERGRGWEWGRERGRDRGGWKRDEDAQQTAQEL